MLVKTGLNGQPFNTLKPGDTMVVKDGKSTLFTVYRPPRPRAESPIQYYKRTKCVPDNYHHIHKGRYYCNPAHCSRSWRSKPERDKHLVGAYAALSD